MYQGVEEYTTALVSYLKTALASKITAINTEKSDSVLTALNSNAYFIQTLDGRITNYPDFVYIQVGQPNIDDTNLGALVVSYPISTYIVLGSLNLEDDNKIAQKLFRYHRALVEVVRDSADTVLKRYKTKVVSLDPAGFVELDASRPVIATGITQELTVGL
jgi:hypothetical protein